VRCNVTEHGAPCTNCRLDEVECIVSESRRKKLVIPSSATFDKPLHADANFHNARMMNGLSSDCRHTKGFFLARPFWTSHAQRVHPITIGHLPTPPSNAAFPMTISGLG
jgi:hypothetical protein